MMHITVLPELSPSRHQQPQYFYAVSLASLACNAAAHAGIVPQLMPVLVVAIEG